MMDGYTYSQLHQSMNYYCSKKDKGCKAKIQLDKEGNVKKADRLHSHPPPQYMCLSSGRYVKI